MEEKKKDFTTIFLTAIFVVVFWNSMDYLLDTLISTYLGNYNPFMVHLTLSLLAIIIFYRVDYAFV